MTGAPGPGAGARAGGLETVIRTSLTAARGETVELRDLVAAMGTSSIAAVLLLPALLLVSPLSGVPGASVVGGLAIALVAGQIALGRRSAWLPEWLLARRLPGSALRAALLRIRRPARRVDRHIRPRAAGIPRAVLDRILGAAATMVGLFMPLLELLPFTSTIAASVVTIIALAILAGDGLLGLVALGLLGLGVGGVFWLV